MVEYGPSAIVRKQEVSVTTTVDGAPILKSGLSNLKPDSITVVYKVSYGEWSAFVVRITGSRVLKDGSMGRTLTEAFYQFAPTSSCPEWARSFAADNMPSDPILGIEHATEAS